MIASHSREAYLVWQAPCRQRERPSVSQSPQHARCINGCYHSCWVAPLIELRGAHQVVSACEKLGLVKRLGENVRHHHVSSHGRRVVSSRIWGRFLSTEYLIFDVYSHHIRHIFAKGEYFGYSHIFVYIRARTDIQKYSKIFDQIFVDIHHATSTDLHGRLVN